MRMLLIDTCGAQGTVALVEDGKVVARETMPGRSASERLVAVVRSALKSAGWRLKELAAVGVVHGPGSFTGVRVGVSAAKGFCEAAGVPLVAVSRLQVLAGKGDAAKGEVVALLDAGRAEVFAGVYRGGICVREELISVEKALKFDGISTVICEEKLVLGLAGLRPKVVSEVAAWDALDIVRGRVERGEFDDVGTLDANYLRRTDWEIQEKEKERAKARAAK